MKNKIILFISALLFIGANSFCADTPLEYFTKVRMDFAKSKSYSPRWTSNVQRKKIIDAWNSGKIDKGQKLAKQWLQKYPFDAEMHVWYGSFFKKQGDYKSYFYHMAMKNGLLASITSSGTGTSKTSPWKVISVSEEYFVLNYLDAKLIKQNLIFNSDGIPCDLMKCTINGKAVDIYFDVSIPMATRNKGLKPKSK